ncbi:hypothetical protein ACET3X_008825 [Alternaria dauci]|uniref:Uncharacterized protein n=1 Tax=Alternaria dauci TaxID=48095 RepID=A0ABR3U782_9PLEO
MPGEDRPSQTPSAHPASRTGISLAALGLDNRRARVHHTLDDWVRQPDLSARLVRFDDSYLQGLAPADIAPDIESLLDATSTIKSDPQSMAPTLLHQSLPETHNPPSLRSCITDATPTESSISTTLASRFSGVPLLEDNNGVLEVPRAHYTTPLYECAFWFLNCSYVSPHSEEWETHCSSHFRGEEPPTTVQCPLCEWGATCDVGREAWGMRMHHLANEHTMRGQTLRTSRPDFGLFQYLWQRRLIDDADLKELKGGNHNLMRRPGNFVETNGREGRRQRAGAQHARVPRRMEARGY